MPVDGSLNVPELMAEVRNTVLSQATGDDQPRPSIPTRHATLSFVDHVMGNLPAASTPAPAGPRNCGHATDGSDPRAAEGTETEDEKDSATSTTNASWRI